MQYIPGPWRSVIDVGSMLVFSTCEGFCSVAEVSSKLGPVIFAMWNFSFCLILKWVNDPSIMHSTDRTSIFQVRNLLHFIFLHGWSPAGRWGSFLWRESHFMLCQIYIPKILRSSMETGWRRKHPSYLSCWSTRTYTLIFGPTRFRNNTCFFSFKHFSMFQLL